MSNAAAPNYLMMHRLLELGVPKTKDRDADAFLASAAADRAALEAVAPLKRGDVVLDLGCGYGRLGCAFAGTDVAYRGLDVNKKRLRYATRLLAGFDATVARLDTHNARYNPGGSSGRGVRLPFYPDTFAAAAAISVFTHMADGAAVAAHLAELARVLVPGGALLTTWLTNGSGKTDHRAFFPVKTVMGLVREAGFEFVLSAGPGTIKDHYRLVTKKRATP